MFQARGVTFREISIDEQPGAAEELERRTGKRGVPYILVDGKHWVHGYHRELPSRLSPELLWSELRAVSSTRTPLVRTALEALPQRAASGRRRRGWPSYAVDQPVSA